MLEHVPDVLRWSADRSALLDLAEDRFATHLAGLLGQKLGVLETERPDRAEIVMRSLEKTGFDLLRATLMSPEVSYRLLWASSTASEDDFWDCLADMLARADAATSCEPPVAGIAVDTLGPGAVRIDPAVAVGLPLCHYRHEESRGAALAKLAAAMQAIDATDAGIATFVRRFTLIASLVTDDEGKRFSSGSVNQYVGRSIFWNAHLPSVDVGLLAEALVHEAIHAFLYMHEACEPWLVGHGDIPSHPVVISPWTGATLRLEPFLQACFVWFGLAHFWRKAAAAGTFSPARAEQGFAMAHSGFCKAPLLSYASSLLPHVNGAVVACVEEMQRAIQARDDRSVAGLVRVVGLEPTFRSLGGGF